MKYKIPILPSNLGNIEVLANNDENGPSSKDYEKEFD
jgi:hypothetical protein